MEAALLTLTCALAAPVFAVDIGKRGPLAVVGVAAAVAGWLVLRPSPGSVGGLAVVFAVWGLLRPRAAVAAAVGTGLVSGLWARLLWGQGLPLVVAAILAAGAPCAAALLAARRPRFAPARLREEARLLVAALGFLGWATPLVTAGWRTAGALNLEPGGGTRVTMAAWVVALSAIAALLGGWRALRRRG